MMLASNFDRHSPLAAAYLGQRASPARRHEAGPNEYEQSGFEAPNEKCAGCEAEVP